MQSCWLNWDVQYLQHIHSLQRASICWTQCFSTNRSSWITESNLCLCVSRDMFHIRCNPAVWDTQQDGPVLTVAASQPQGHRVHVCSKIHLYIHPSHASASQIDKMEISNYTEWNIVVQYSETSPKTENPVCSVCWANYFTVSRAPPPKSLHLFSL